jgi:histidine ammonia-lyase
MAILKKQYTLAEISALWKSGESIEIPADILGGIAASAAYLPRFLANAGHPVYGINTGFGSLQNVVVPDNELHELQRNLLVTHAAGVGNYLSDDLVRLMLLLKILNIAKGHSAVRTEVVERLLFFYNNHYTPRVHEQGSLGASGDLAPLSEMCLPLIGMGELQHPTKGIQPSDTVLREHGLQKLTLEPKEALALINGTQFMLAHAIGLYAKTRQLLEQLPIIAAFSADVFLCRKEPFFPQLHAVRPHAGQQKAAKEMLAFLEKSNLQNEARPAVQDAYSFRCIPQVHGASYDALQHCFSVWEIELNSVTDNPTVFEEDDLVLSGGNFHGQPLALTLDYAAIALAELANISERRTYLLVSGQRGLPPFLAPNPGTDSGYMIAQYTAASLVSQNKQLCTPASVDSIMSSNGQEDHVSMGANAATKALRVMENVRNVLAIELMCACQARNFRNDPSFAEAEKLHELLYLTQDKHVFDPMHVLINEAAVLLWNN